MFIGIIYKNTQKQNQFRLQVEDKIVLTFIWSPTLVPIGYTR